MSGCRINRNKNISGDKDSKDNKDNKEGYTKEFADKLAALIEERKNQDAALNTVLTEEEYDQKYGKGPGTLTKT